MEGRSDKNNAKKVTDNIDASHSKSLMTAHKINSASLAYFKLGDPIEPMVLTHEKSKGDVTKETRYRIASLSKTIFAHLVEKLIEENKTKKKEEWVGKFELPDNLKDKRFDLDTPLHLILPFEGLSGNDVEKAKLITAKMILSHTSGLPLKPGEGPHALLFNPGEKYSYSNLGFEYLQKVIEKLTNKKLEPLAQTHVFKPLGMNNSTFMPPTGEAGGAPKEIAQNSVHTTPTDFALFALEMMKTQKQNHAFTKNKNLDSMKSDEQAVGQGLQEQTINIISWGNGWALQLDERGDPEKAFHWGDYGDAGLNWRAMVVLDLKKNEGMVYMSDSGNGMLLLDQIFNDKTVSLKHGLEFIFEKYGFARENELSNPHWEQEQWDRIGRIIALYEEKIVINDDKDACRLTVKCDPLLSNWKSKEITDGIMTELEKFNNDNSKAKDHCNVQIEHVSKDNISSLTINISDRKLYDAFISQLNEKKLLLALTPLPNQRLDPQNKKPSQATHGPANNTNHDTSRDHLRSRYMKITQKIVPPKSVSSIPPSAQPSTTPNPVQSDEPRKKPGMTPLSTQLKPPGSK